MGRIVGLAAIFLVGQSLTALLTIAWMLLLNYGRKRRNQMGGDDWEIYFRDIPIWGYVVRGLIYLTLALWVSVPLVYAALRLFHYENRVGLCLLFTALTVAAVSVRCICRRKYLTEKLYQLKGLHE